jgi:hypothetical protein
LAEGNFLLFGEGQFSRRRLNGLNKPGKSVAISHQIEESSTYFFAKSSPNIKNLGFKWLQE